MWNLQEAISHYRAQGAPSSQPQLVALLREVQQEHGGAIPEDALEEIARALAVRRSFLDAVLRRYPSLRTHAAPHRLEICGGPNCARQRSAALIDFVEKTYQVKSGGVSTAGGFSFRISGCMKHCGCGPNCKWDGQVYSHADAKLLQQLIGRK